MEMDQETINQRLNLIVDSFEKGVKAAFARKAGISSQGAQELLAGRKGDPSFKVLVKILESYPTIDANWLVLGRGAMLQHSITDETGLLPDSVYSITEEQFEKIIPLLLEKMADNPGLKAQTGEVYAAAFANAEVANQVYHVADSYISRKAQLSVRLGISEDQARHLVVEGMIKSKYIDTVNDYMVTEEAVREFLGEPLQSSRK